MLNMFVWLSESSLQDLMSCRSWCNRNQCLLTWVSRWLYTSWDVWMYLADPLCCSSHIRAVWSALWNHPVTIKRLQQHLGWVVIRLWCHDLNWCVLLPQITLLLILWVACSPVIRSCGCCPTLLHPWQHHIQCHHVLIYDWFLIFHFNAKRHALWIIYN